MWGVWGVWGVWEVWEVWEDLVMVEDGTFFGRVSGTEFYH